MLPIIVAATVTDDTRVKNKKKKNIQTNIPHDISINTTSHQ
jgi:hypothetical protein